MGIVEGVVGEAAAGAVGGPGGAALLFMRKHWKGVLIAIAVLALAAVVAKHFGDDEHVRKQRDGLQAWQTAVVAITAAELPKDKNGRTPKLGSSDVVANIQWLGNERLRLGKALDDQTAALNAAKASAEADQEAATEALQLAHQRDVERQATIKALTDPKRTTALTADEWSRL